MKRLHATNTLFQERKKISLAHFERFNYKELR